MVIFPCKRLLEIMFMVFMYVLRLHDKISHPVPAPVLEIDANVDLVEMLEQVTLVENQILNRKKKRVHSSPVISPSKIVSSA